MTKKRAKLLWWAAAIIVALYLALEFAEDLLRALE